MSAVRPAYQRDQHIELKIWLMRHNLSQRRIAKQLGVTVQTLNKLLLQKYPGQHLRKRLVSEFGIPAELVEYRPVKSAKRAA